MHVEFKARTGIRTPSGGECVSCGFVATVGLTTSQDDVTECLVCDAAHHAGEAIDRGFLFTWAPEIDQRDLAHLSRVTALLAVRNESLMSKEDANRRSSKVGAEEIKRPEADRLLKLFSDLRQRAEVLGKALDSLVNARLPAAWEHLDGETQEFLFHGLRVFPEGIDVTHVDAWAEAGTLNGFGFDFIEVNGFGFDFLDKKKWFSGDAPGTESKRDAALHGLQESSPGIPEKSVKSSSGEISAVPDSNIRHYPDFSDLVDDHAEGDAK